jgi:hypothetical protein
MKTGARILAAAALLFAGGWALEAAVQPGTNLAVAAMVARAIAVVLFVPGMIKLAFGHLKERDATRAEVPPASAGSSRALACPRCGSMTFNLKRVRLTDVTFFVLGASIRPAQYTGCPPCTRGEIEEHLLRNLLSANLLWIAPAVQGSVALAQSFTSGHSRDIRLIAEQRLSEASRRIGA